MVENPCKSQGHSDSLVLIKESTHQFCPSCYATWLLSETQTFLRDSDSQIVSISELIINEKVGGYKDREQVQ